MTPAAVDRLRPVYANHARGEFFLDNEIWHPEIEMVFSEEFPEPGPFRGREEFPEAFATWLRAWDRWEVHVEQMHSLPDGRVVAFVRFCGYGRGSGIPVESLGAQIWTFADDGLVRRLEIHATRVAANEILASFI